MLVEMRQRLNLVLHDVCNLLSVNYLGDFVKGL